MEKPRGKCPPEFEQSRRDEAAAQKHHQGGQETLRMTQGYLRSDGEARGDIWWVACGPPAPTLRGHDPFTQPGARIRSQVET